MITTTTTQPRTLQDFKQAVDNAVIPRPQVRQEFGDLSEDNYLRESLPALYRSPTAIGKL